MEDDQKKQDQSQPMDTSATEGESDTDASTAPPEDDEVDRSGDPDAEEKALAHKTTGNDFLQKDRFSQAIEEYSMALTYKPSFSAVLLSNRALACIKLENYGLALQDADAALAADPRYVKAYYRRASANLALQHFKKARKDFKAVVTLKPKSADAKSKLKMVEKIVREQAFAKAIEAEATIPLSETYKVEDVIVPESYDGPRPDPGTDPDSDEALLFAPGALSHAFVTAAMAHFKDQKLIHKRYLAHTLLAARRYFAEQPSLMRIEIPKGHRVTVCGDTHGQYYDVLNIFELNGLPSATNPYLFNGDFVDRGSFSVEVITVFLLWKLHDPTCIYLTRGNHETLNMNKIYGFEGEVKAKYDEKIFQLFLEVFQWIPLAAVIQDSVFVTHGGISTDDSVTLDDVNAIVRGKEPPETSLMSDLLWSDPQTLPGKAPSQRGVGFSFGPDIAHAFLERNKLSLLVRSHQVKDEGYVVEHDGKTITVFSAPNYCDRMGNKGAFIHFSVENNLEPVYTQFDAVSHPDVQPMAYAAGMGGLFG